MSPKMLDAYETRTPDPTGWLGFPFRHPSDGTPVVTAQSDSGKHDGGPMPPEAPRDPAPSGGDGK
ncbi:hypothetical protein [Streptomyces sp. NPDC049881]|uniref:hypothetical protein n=1 Tax=Streptomyces sp. NPDC049881 TaxID=3155778 RepID=UPI00342155F7